MLMELATLLQGHLSREKPLTQGAPIIMTRLSTTVAGSGFGMGPRARQSEQFPGNFQMRVKEKEPKAIRR